MLTIMINLWLLLTILNVSMRSVYNFQYNFVFLAPFEISMLIRCFVCNPYQSSAHKKNSCITLQALHRNTNCAH